jgi:hypothetical protein
VRALAMVAGQRSPWARAFTGFLLPAIPVVPTARWVADFVSFVRNRVRFMIGGLV